MRWALHKVLIILLDFQKLKIQQILESSGNKIPEPPARALLRAKLHQQLDGQRLSEVLEQLKRCPAGLDPALGKSIRFGVAYHHAGNEIKSRYFCESIWSSLCYV